MELDNKTGSLNVDGNVVNVNFNPDNGKVYVNYWNQGNANPNVRTRSEVTA